MTRWNLQSGANIWLGGHATEGKRLLHQQLIDMPRPPIGPIDAAFITPESMDEAIHFSQKLSTRLGPGKRLWILTPTQLANEQPSTWLGLDERMFDLGFTKVATEDVEQQYQILGYEHTTVALS